MKSLFEAILLIVSFTAIFLLYYLLKKWLQIFKEKRKVQKYIRIIKEEKRAQWYRIFQVALVRMKTDRAFWAEIYIHGKNDDRLSVEHRPGNESWKFKFGYRNLDVEIQTDLNKYGKYIKTETENFDVVECPDSEHLLDCIFYFLDRVIRISEDAEIKLKY